MPILPSSVSKTQTWEGEFTEELKNTDKKGTSTKRKIGKVTYGTVVHLNGDAPEAMQDRFTRIMLRELRRKSDERKEDFD